MMKINQQNERGEKGFENSAKMMLGFQKYQTGRGSQIRLFGTITKIEGNKLTVLDNAANEQIIVSGASTIIMTSSTEIGLSVLEPGQNIIIAGILNKDNAIDAQLISVL